MRTVFHPVSPQVAGQIMKVKELVAVSEVEQSMTVREMRDRRKPDPGYYIETPFQELSETLEDDSDERNEDLRNAKIAS